MGKNLNNANPSIDEVKMWAFQDEVYFIEQDEDLILHSPDYISILAELSSDTKCPKRDYCLSILSHYTQILLANRNMNELRQVALQVTNYNPPLSGDVDKWKSDFLYFMDLINNPRSIQENEADNVAYRLIAGAHTIRDFKKLGSFKSGILEYSASTSSYVEYFYINPNTSNWKLSKLFKLDDSLSL